MKQSIIAVIITAIVGVCGGSLGLKPPTEGNVTTTAAGEQVTNIVAQTTQPTTTCKSTKPQPTTGAQTTKPENKSFARQVVELVNKERNKAGLNSLSIDTKIEYAAMVRSKEIEKSFSHTRPNGSSFSTVLSESDVNFRGAGENIAWGQRSPEEVMNGWMNSSGHRANILNSNFKNIGVAYYVGSNGRTYWTQLFTY